MEEIIGKTIELNRFTAPVTWDPNSDYMRIFLNNIERYLNDLLRVKGYLSWETICDSLGYDISADEVENHKCLRLPQIFEMEKVYNEEADSWLITFKEVE